jgi:hypothetical protein
MDEQPERYREVRALLEQLVASWPWDRPGAAFENAKVYLDFHCADCGAKLSVNDLAVVLELEMLRLGTVDARKVPSFDPICVRCYIRRAAPECRAVDHVVDRTVGMDACRLVDARGAEHGALLASAGTTHALALQNATGTREEHPAPLRSSPLLHPIQDAMSSQPTRSQRAWWWRHTGKCFLVVAMLLIVLALGIALRSFPSRAHTSTLTRPTAPAVPTTAVPTSQPGNQSFRVGTWRTCATNHTASALSDCAWQDMEA